MNQIKLDTLRDIKTDLGKKLVRMAKNEKITLSCPECGKSFGAFSLNYWLDHKSQTCSNKECGEKTQIEPSKLISQMREIEKM